MVRSLVVAVCVAATGCSSAGPAITVEAGLYTPQISGRVGLATSVVTDVNTIDLQSSLDLGDRQYVPYLRAELNAGGFDLALSGFKTSQTGTGSVTAGFGSITAGSTVNSKLDMGFVHGRATFDLLDAKWLTLGAGLGADYVDIKLDAKEIVFGLDESIAVKQALPLVVARGVVRPPMLPIDFALEVSGITGHYQDIDGTLIDVEALLHYNVVGPLSVFGGYRFIHFAIKGSASGRSFDGNVGLSGFLLGASFRF